MNFIQALQTKDTFTENGMPTHSTSGSALVDLFFHMGGSRFLDERSLRLLFAEAYAEDAALAVKAAFYNRDIREGQGERRSFRFFFRYLCEVAPSVAVANLHNVPFFGRWDDLLVAIDSPVEQAALSYIAQALKNGDKLCAKWMPREGKQVKKDTGGTVVGRTPRRGSAQAKVLREFMGLSSKDYRKLLAGNTAVVENLMCSRNWNTIQYNGVPSIAIRKYRKAFLRHDPTRYSQWVEALSDPESGAKINAGATFPHDIVRPFMGANTMDIIEKRALQAQWEALPDFVPEGQSFIPVSDVSGSMEGLPMEVSVSLGLYLAERNKGPFHNAFITFSERPQLHVIRARDLESRVVEVMGADWGMNTDLEAVFRLILEKAVAARLPQEEMPQNLLILSDMQFDQACRNASDAVMEMIDRMYQEKGYTRPNIVFWNLRSSKGTPAKTDERGTSLVSGFSPSILKTIFAGVAMTPISVVLDTLNSERYDRVVGSAPSGGVQSFYT